MGVELISNPAKWSNFDYLWWRTAAMNDPATGFVFYFVFLVSTTLHEAAHAWAAKRGGDLTAYEGGQVSVDPIPHIKREPFGMVVLPILTVVLSGWPIGYASAPYDREWAREHPNRAAWMSLAGPAANIALVIVAALLIRLGMSLDIFHPPEAINFGKITASDVSSAWNSAGFLLGAFFSLNLLLFVFNMFPVPPLDGSGALPLLLSRSAGERWSRFIEQPMLGMIGILIAWQLFDEIFTPVFFASLALLYPEVSYG